MSSTTGTKKNLIDFLWDWAENYGEWSKLLVSSIVMSEKPLIQSERETVFKYFLQDIGLKKGLPAISKTKPTYIPVSKKIEILSLSDIKGVNKLAQNQCINFSKNLTVVYGENGTGKTGYSRILKSLGFSYDNSTKILPDIYAKPTPMAACIKYKVEEKEYTFNWNGTTPNMDLQTISVFNNSCVNISLNDGRQLIVSPIGFHLFNLISDELNELNKMLNEKINTLQYPLEWTKDLHTNTPHFTYMETLSPTSSKMRLEELKMFSTEQEKEIELKEEELKRLNRTLLETEIKNLNLQFFELDEFICNIESINKKIDTSIFKNFVNIKRKIIELKEKAQLGIKDIAETNGIEFYQTTEFETFLKSAEEYIKLLKRNDYPNNDDICIYCRQPIMTDEAKKLLKSYHLLLNDTTQDELRSLNKQKDELIRILKNIKVNFTFHQPTFGTNEDGSNKQPNEIIQFSEKISFFINLIIEDSENIFDKEFDVDYAAIKSFLLSAKKTINDTISTKKEILQNIEAQESKIQLTINELKDRQLFSKHYQDIINAIEVLKKKELLDKKHSCFNTTSISKKTTDAREELIKSHFIENFNRELKFLRKTHINVELNFGTAKGVSKIQQKLNTKYFLSDILSEGEQKAIALAEFLTELQLDKNIAPVVFDDPVNSLDHNIIDDVARRLIRLSNERQVVIFTHSVLLFNSILYFSKQPLFKNTTCIFLNSKSEFGETGVITEAEEEINSVNKYISKINPLINNTPKGRSESDVASDGYGYLRSAIELCVEQEIFQGTVKRYQKNIALTSFVKVNGELLNQCKDKLNEIFERSCGYIKGHSNPTEIDNEPKLSEFIEDYNDFKRIRGLFIK
jgi:hypothetical protein